MSENEEDETIARSLYWSNDRACEVFSTDHPARKYLVTFYETRGEVCGRDIDWPNHPRIEQEWESKLLKRPFSFSLFAYIFLGYSLTVEEWFDVCYARSVSICEEKRVAQFAMQQELIEECRHAAERDNNAEILRFLQLSQALLKLGIQAIAHRINMTFDEVLEHWGQDSISAADAFIQNNSPRKSSCNEK